ncbi:hypothetical protein [Dyella sp. Tek66A03]|uniref:hypothetical protein n=1 Tax=Dyella sp. Tek66A03 TaxID=3458298 RepID=UPI00403EF1BA
MTDRRVMNLLYALLVLVAFNLGLTIYFQATKPQPVADLSANPGGAAAQISDKEAMALAHSVVDLYNANDTHGLYLKFDDLARLQLTEQSLGEKLAKLQSMIGRVQDFAYSNAEVAGKSGGRTFLTLNYKARLTGGTFSSGAIRLTVAMKDGHASLFGFFINGQAD